jgi:molecular chaperone DnaK (HSP70)
MGKVVGIDLGTTNSLVAYVRDGAPVVIRDASGDALVPSVVSLGSDGTIFVGREAQRRLLTSADRTVYSVKRFMGRGIEDVRDEAALLPFRIAATPAASCASASAIASSRRRDLGVRAARAEATRRGSLPRGASSTTRSTRAVITVPAYFNDAQRTATRDAGRSPARGAAHHQRADRGVARLRLDKRERGTIAVYDLGGGTFDISILRRRGRRLPGRSRPTATRISAGTISIAC